MLTLIKDSDVYGRVLWPWGATLLALFALMLGTLASINLWELPTYALWALVRCSSPNIAMTAASTGR